MMFAQWIKAQSPTLHWAFVPFLAYATLSLAWTPNVPDGLNAVTALAALGLCLALGLLWPIPRAAWFALAASGAASSAMAVAQAAGWQPFPTYQSRYAGLFFSPIAQGETLALLAILLLSARFWWLCLPLVPGIALAQSRGGLAALALGILAMARRPILLLLLALLAAYAFTLSPTQADLERLQIWQASSSLLTWQGNGAGSFLSLWLSKDGLAHQPEFAHNDYLQFAFEYGLGFLPLLALFAVGLAQTTSRHWPALVAFIFMAAFSFPSFTPTVAALGFLTLGQVLRKEI